MNMAINKDADVAGDENAVATDTNAEQSNDAPDIYEQLAEKAQALRESEDGNAGEVAQDKPKTDVNSQVDAALVLVDDLDHKTVRIKLDGQEQEMKLSDVVRGFQKEAVASKRLNEATAKLKEADEYLAKAKSAPVNEQQNQQYAGDDVKVVAKSAIEALLNGDEEGAAEALERLANRRGNSTEQANTSDVALEVKRQLEVDSALTEFQAEYADVVSDPYLAGITNNFLKEEMQTGAHGGMSDALKAAGDKARDWLANLTGIKTYNQRSTIRNDRVAKKAGMEQIPANSASAASLSEPEESAADVINQMRKERGLVT